MGMGINSLIILMVINNSPTAMAGISPPMAGMAIIIHTVTIPIVPILIITDINIPLGREGAFTGLVLEAKLD